MASQKTENVHYFDAVGSFALPCVITAVLWSGATSAADAVSISEYSGTAGNIIFKQTADAQKGTPPVCGIGATVDGFRVDTLDSGYVLVYTG